MRSMLVCARAGATTARLAGLAGRLGPGYRLGTADSVPASLAWLARHRADVVLVDMLAVVPDAGWFIRQVRQRSPAAVVIAVGVADEKAAATMVAAGAAGVVGAEPGGLLVELAEVLVLACFGAVPPAGQRLLLTVREYQVLVGMSEGKTNAEIGRELFVAEDTVKTHVRRLFRKLRVHDRAQAVAVAFRDGVLPLDRTPS